MEGHRDANNALFNLLWEIVSNSQRVIIYLWRWRGILFQQLNYLAFFRKALRLGTGKRHLVIHDYVQSAESVIKGSEVSLHPEGAV